MNVLHSPDEGAGAGAGANPEGSQQATPEEGAGQVETIQVGDETFRSDDPDLISKLAIFTM